MLGPLMLLNDSKSQNKIFAQYHRSAFPTRSVA